MRMESDGNDDEDDDDDEEPEKAPDAENVARSQG